MIKDPKYIYDNLEDFGDLDHVGWPFTSRFLEVLNFFLSVSFCLVAAGYKRRVNLSKSTLNPSEYKLGTEE